MQIVKEDIRCCLRNFSYSPDQQARIKDFVDYLRRQNFEETNKVHDWRNHVPALLISEWDVLSDQSRVSAYVIAKEAADNEEWE